MEIVFTKKNIFNSSFFRRATQILHVMYFNILYSFSYSIICIFTDIALLKKEKKNV